MADPKDPKYRKNETWQTGGIKINAEPEKPQAPENVQNPSANALETASSAEGQTSQRPLFLGESAPHQSTKTQENTSKNDIKKDIINNEKVIKSATEIDPTDKGKKLTVAGRSYKKHSEHETSSISKPKGSPEQINQQAHHHINEILNDPHKIIKKHQNPNGRFGETYTLHSSNPNKDGIRVSSENDFIHFIDPK